MYYCYSKQAPAKHQLRILDSLGLQDVIADFEELLHPWLLKFHPNNCHLLSLGKPENIMYRHRYKRKENLTYLKEKVVMNSDLTFGEHITEKVKKGNKKRGLHINSFYCRLVDMWNSLPCSVVDAPTLNTFQNRQDGHRKNLPLKLDHDYAGEDEEEE